jgi:hypothetical protein
MTQEELLVLVYKKDERAFTHLWYVLKSLFSVINVLVKNREERGCSARGVCQNMEKHWFL